MLKKRTSLYLLFPLVVIIWGAIILKVTAAFKDESVIVATPPRPDIKEIIQVKKDTFSLLPVERDPFLGHYYKEFVQPKPKQTAKQKPEWPEILYLGLVSGTGNSSSIHILQVNGKQLLIEEYETSEKIKVVGSTTGEVTLLYGGERKKFRKGPSL